MPDNRDSVDLRFDSSELVLIAPGRKGSVLLRTEFPRTIKLEPADARELARQLTRAAEVAEGA